MKFTWGHGIIFFFIIFFTWIIGFVIFTLGRNNDLVTEDYYKQGAEYSTHMAIDKRSKIYKDSISISNTESDVQISFSSSLAHNNTEKEIYFYRPSNKKDDLKILSKAKQNIALVNKEQLNAGRYKVSFSWKMNGKQYRITKDFEVK